MVLLHDRAVYREREHQPLELFDAAIDVRVEIDHAILLVERFRVLTPAVSNNLIKAARKTFKMLTLRKSNNHLLI